MSEAWKGRNNGGTTRRGEEEERLIWLKGSGISTQAWAAYIGGIIIALVA